MFLNTKGLVLREVKYKEADKILTVLTESDGKLTVSARGAMRKSGRISAASAQMTYSEMTLFGNKGRWSLNEAEIIEQFIGLRQDISLLALGNYITEMLEAVSDEDSPNPSLLRLGLNSLYALSRGMYSQEHIKAAFEMRLMCISGYEPFLSGCGVCGTAEAVDPLFSLNGGVLHCRGCRDGHPGVSLPLCPDSLTALRYIVQADLKKLFSFSIEEDAQRRLADVCEAYVLAQLERGFNSLDYWKSVR